MGGIPASLWEAVDVPSVQKLCVDLELYGYCDDALQTPLLLAVAQVGQLTGAGAEAPLEHRIAVLTALLDELTATGEGRLLSRLVSKNHLGARTQTKRSVLHVAADTWLTFTPELESLARRLISAAVEAGVGLDDKDSSRYTAVHLAATSGSGFLELLLEQGGNFDAIAKDEMTLLLDLAAFRGHTHLVEILLNQPNAHIAQHILQLAIEGAHTYSKGHEELKQRVELMDLMLQHPRIDPQALDGQGRTFLFSTCAWINLTEHLVPLLRHVLGLASKLGVAVNHQDKQGNTVLHELVRRARPNASVQYLDEFIDVGADVSIRNYKGQLPSEVEKECPDHTALADRMAKYEQCCKGAGVIAEAAADSAVSFSSVKRQRVAISSSDDEEDERPLSQRRSQGQEQQWKALQQKQQLPSPPKVGQQESQGQRQQSTHRQSPPRQQPQSDAEAATPAAAAAILSLAGAAAMAEDAQPRQRLLSILEQCKAAGVLGKGVAGRFRALLNHQPESLEHHAAFLGELAQAGELTALAACVQHATSTAVKAGAAQAPPSNSQLCRLRVLLVNCREAGALDLRSAAFYSTAFCHSLSAEQREDDLSNCEELLPDEPGDAAACVLVAVASMRWAVA